MTVDVGSTPLGTAVKFCIENNYLGGEKRITYFTLTNRDAEVLHDTMEEMMDDWTRAEPVDLRNMGIRLKPDFRNNAVQMSFSRCSDSYGIIRYSSGTSDDSYSPGLRMSVPREELKRMCWLIEKAILLRLDMTKNNAEYFEHLLKVTE